MRHLNSAIFRGAIIVSILAAATDASALTIRLTDTVSSITVDDNAAGDDVDPVVGELLYDSDIASSTLSGAFSFIEVSATTKPLIGLPNLAELVFEIEADSDFLAETLTLEVTETDFTLNDSLPWAGVHALGGIAAGDVEIEAYWDPGNTAFATTNSIGGPFSFGSTVDPFEGFSSTLFDNEVGSSPFSMTTVLTITHSAGDEVTEVASGSALSAVPVPTSLPLLAGAIGFGLIFARRRVRMRD